ncbi:MAG: CDP-alcohol phosphatidyltransferase family protein [Elusimicrobiales bacterium]|nr:CDP-alcohol phosphatidyltransferase family protein [Elusimicrobiales bacterium]
MSGFVVALAGLTGLIHIGSLGPWPGIALMTLYSLSDAVDGNMARATGTVTYFGKMLDGVLGLLAEGLFFPALGIGLHLAGTGTGLFLGRPWLHTLLGAAALTFMLYSSIVEGSFDRYAAEKERSRGAGSLPPDSTIGTSRYRNSLFYLLYLNLQSFNVQLVALAILAVCGRMELFLPAACGFYAVKTILVAAYYLRRAAAELS